MKKPLALVLALVFALSFTACGKSDEEKILGSWTTEIEKEPDLMYQVTGHDPEPLCVVATVTFGEDGGLELNGENGLPFGSDIAAPAAFTRAE